MRKDSHVTIKKGWSVADLTWRGVRIYSIFGLTEEDKTEIIELSEKATLLKHKNVETLDSYQVRPNVYVVQSENILSPTVRCCLS